MKKILAILLTLAAVVTAAVPAAAVVNAENQHQIAEILSITESAVEEHVLKYQHVKEAAMMAAVDAAEEDVIPAEYEIRHLTMVRQRIIHNDGEPTEISIRAWGATESQYIVVLFQPEGEEDWIVVAAAQGQYIDATIPGDGQYALAWSWG